MYKSKESYMLFSSVYIFEYTTLGHSPKPNYSHKPGLGFLLENITRGGGGGGKTEHRENFGVRLNSAQQRAF